MRTYSLVCGFKQNVFVTHIFLTNKYNIQICLVKKACSAEESLSIPEYRKILTIFIRYSRVRAHGCIHALESLELGQKQALPCPREEIKKRKGEIARVKAHKAKEICLE
jgi:hypothetical protein